MLQRTLPAVAILFSVLGTSPDVLAQKAQPASEVRPLPPGEPPSGRSAKRERLRRKIRAMRAWYLTQELDLDHASGERLFSLLDRYDDSLDRLQQKGSALRRALRQEMASARPDRGLIRRQVDDLVAHYDELYQVQSERFSAVRKVVTPEQSAKLLLLLPKIDSAIRRQIARVMRNQRSDESRRGRRGRRGERGRDDGTRPLDPFSGR